MSRSQPLASSCQPLEGSCWKKIFSLHLLKKFPRTPYIPSFQMWVSLPESKAILCLAPGDLSNLISPVSPSGANWPFHQLQHASQFFLMLAPGKPLPCHLLGVFPNLIHLSRLFLFSLDASSTDNLTYLLAPHLRLVTNIYAPHPSWAWSVETENVPWRLTQLLSVQNRHGLPPSPWEGTPTDTTPWPHIITPYDYRLLPALRSSLGVLPLPSG